MSIFCSKVYINDDPGLTLTFFTARSNLLISIERLVDHWLSGIYKLFMRS